MRRPAISHVGLFAGDLVATYELDDSLKIGVHQQANFQHFDKIASRGSRQGTVVLGGNSMPMGVITDVSPQGDTCGVDTAGYIWVVGDPTGVTYGSLVTCVPGGTLASCADPLYATESEKRNGCWQADEIRGNKILIMIDCYL